MNVLLIHTYISARFPGISLTEPLGLMALASFLEESFGAKIKVNILDLYALGQDIPQKNNNLYITGIYNKKEIGAHLEKYNPDFVGIHCNFSSFCQDSYEVAAIVKYFIPKIPVVIGGAHASMEAKNILMEHSYIDYVVCGEGENILKELITTLMNADYNSISTIKGICYRERDGTVVRTPERELIADINQLPVPDRKFIDSEFYMKMNSKSLPLAKKKPLGTIMTSRGCPFDCIFCSTKMMWKRRWRALTAERVMQDIEHLVNAYSVSEIVIYDDQFIIDKKRVHRICDYLIERNLKITLSLPAGTSVWLLDKELLIKMKKAGFYRLCFPIESGNEKTIKFIRKNINLNDILEKIKLTNKLGYWTQGNFILGFPYETREEIEKTIKFAYTCGLDFAFFYIAKPFAGSEMYDLYKKEGLLDKTERSSQIYTSDCNTKTLTSTELNQIHAEAVKGFLPHKLIWCMNPYNLYNYIFPKIKTYEDLCYAARLFYFIFLKNLFNKCKVVWAKLL